LELLENGPKSLSQAWLLGALHNEWKKMKGYQDEYPDETRVNYNPHCQNGKKV